MDLNSSTACSRYARPLASGMLLLGLTLAGCFVGRRERASVGRAAPANGLRLDTPVLPATPYPYVASAESAAARLARRGPGGIGFRGARGGGGRGGRGGFGRALA